MSGTVANGLFGLPWLWSCGVTAASALMTCWSAAPMILPNTVKPLSFVSRLFGGPPLFAVEEELAGGAVRIARRFGHGEGAHRIGGAELVLHGRVGLDRHKIGGGAGLKRETPALEHEASRQPVEDRAVEPIAGDVVEEVRHRL